MRTTRFIVITVPPAAVADEITSLMRRASRLSGAEVALRYPPHVTVRTGAHVPDDHIDSYVRGLDRHLRDTAPFIIQTDRFVHETYASDHRRKHFFGYVIKKSSALLNLHERLMQFSVHMKPGAQPFRPHLSIAYDDVPDAGAKAIDEAIRRGGIHVPEAIEWRCDNVCLFSQSGENWVERHRSTFAGPCT